VVTTLILNTLTYVTLCYAEGVLAPSAEASVGPMRFPMSPLNLNHPVRTQFTSIPSSHCDLPYAVKQWIGQYDVSA